MAGAAVALVRRPCACRQQQLMRGPFRVVRGGAAMLMFGVGGRRLPDVCAPRCPSVSVGGGEKSLVARVWRCDAC